MARSVGITASAVVVLICSALTILFGAVAMLGSFALSLHPMPNGPAHLGYVIVSEAVFAFGLGGWGVASGVGLIRTKEWARISMIVFAALLMFCTLPATLIFAFVPIPIPQDPNLPSNFASLLRLCMVLFYGLLAAVAGFWLYFFNTRTVKGQFQGTRAAVEAASTCLPAQTLGMNPTAPSHPRPLSITIIAWFLLIGSAFAPLGLLYSRAVFHNVPIPLCFLGFFVFGPTATLILLVWMTVQIFAAIGLLKLKNWARLATIALQCLGVLNILLLEGIPANRVRYQQIMDSMMDSMMASMNARMSQPSSFTFPAWALMIASLPLFLVILWFLIRRKHAFVKHDDLASIEA